MTPWNDIEATSARARMIASQLVARGIDDGRVLHAMLEVPREAFVAAAIRPRAYADSPQSIPCGQTISQPYIVAYMLQLAEIKPSDRSLEIGTGTGYEAALLAHLTAHVTTVERHRLLADEARRNIAALGIANCDVRVGDGTLGVSDAAPFDVILVAASGPCVPPRLVEQLAPGGRLICPVGSRADQRLVRVRRDLDGRVLGEEQLDPVVFVPLIGEGGWTTEPTR